jgi:neutral ceramidase
MGMGMTNGWSIGFAQGEITPKNAVHMAGYGRERYAEGTIAPLIAQAVVLKDGEGRMGVIITADVLGFERVTLHVMRERIFKKHGIGGANVMLAPSHTHWGPATHYRFNYGGGGPSFWYLKWLEEKMLALVDEAAGDVTAGTVEYFDAVGQVGRCRRRYVTETKEVLWEANEAGHYDRHTPVLKISRPGHGSVKQVVIVAHACHPTSSGSVNKWTPDYPGAMRDKLEAELGAQTRAVFVMGPGADAKVCHAEGAEGEMRFTASPEGAKAAGEKLAGQVLEFIGGKRAGVVVGPRLKTASASVDLALTRWKTAEELKAFVADETSPVWDAAFARQALELPDLRVAYPYEVVGWKLGEELTLIGMPDEVCSPWGPRARGMAKTPHAMVAGYVNHVQCYIPDERIRFEGGYEGDTSHRAYFMPGPFAEGLEGGIDGVIERVVGALG